MVWGKQKDHSTDCYFCLTDKAWITSKSKHTEKYPHFPSVMRPVPHREELPVPNSPEKLTFNNYNSNYDEDRGQQEGDYVDSNPVFEASCPSSEFFFQ
jgi:hypothetical protein